MILVEIRGDDVKIRVANKMEICEAVYMLLNLIPIGNVTSYSSIARALGIHPRLVAWCLKRNTKPIVIPCHRVVYASGRIGGYSLGGSDFKLKLLHLEGIRFERRDRVTRTHLVDLENLLYNDAQRS